MDSFRSDFLHFLLFLRPAEPRPLRPAALCCCCRPCPKIRSLPPAQRLRHTYWRCRLFWRPRSYRPDTQAYTGWICRQWSGIRFHPPCRQNSWCRFRPTRWIPHSAPYPSAARPPHWHCRSSSLRPTLSPGWPARFFPLRPACLPCTPLFPLRSRFAARAEYSRRAAAEPPCIRRASHPRPVPCRFPHPAQPRWCCRFCP